MPKGYSCKTSHMDCCIPVFLMMHCGINIFILCRIEGDVREKYKKHNLKSYSSKRLLMQNLAYGVVYQIRQPDSISKFRHVVNVNGKIFKLKLLIE